MTIPFVDLKAQYSGIKSEIGAAIDRVLADGQYVLGEEVAAFEREFGAFCGANHAVAVNSGTSALHLALLAAGVGPGDEVITVPFTFVATVAAICYTGARPILVDIDPISYTMDFDRFEQAITPRTRAVIPVHLYGQPADLDPIRDVAKRHNIVVIEDAAQAHGAEYKGRPIGSTGDMACFSFYPSKNLGACGEGGMVTTNNSEYEHTIRMLRDWGDERKYHHRLKGYNYRMDALQGAILRVKLRRLKAWTDARRTHADFYNRLFSDSLVNTPREMPYARHVYHLYVVRTKERDELAKALLKGRIHTGIHYPIPVHLQEGYSDLGFRAGDFPCSEQAAREVLSLPMYPELSKAQQENVAAEVRQARAG